jgi:hypothetical protein
MKRTLLSLALLAAGLVGGNAPLLAADTASAAKPAVATVAVPDPAAQLTQLARLFRAGDVGALVKAVVPPSRWEEVELTYQLAQLEPISDEDRAEFAAKLEKFTAPDAVDRLMAEIEPKLEEARPQLPGAILMAVGSAQMALNSPETRITEEQREALRAALPGFAEWVQTTDFLSSDTLREALTLMTEAARRTGIRDIEQARALPLAALFDHGSAMLAAGKRAVALYGIDLDQVADSLRVETLSVEGETARVRTTVTLFDAPVFVDHDLVLVEGRWIGKGMARSFEYRGKWHDHDKGDKGDEGDDAGAPAAGEAAVERASQG